MTPVFEKENIETLIDRIHDFDSQSADEIIETYARRGQHFLRNIWDKHHKNDD
ncbi:MAG: hypothetical protein JW774_09155 [Candidatus Aureabacteria bacterium]|nr:hypothetical protein [Candidatus Auribacterota bacterium]